MTRFEDIPDLILGPLGGRPDDDWYRAPVGKWNAAQIVDHLALGLEWTAAGFEERRARDPMVRRRRTVKQRASRVLMAIGAFPPGLQAPRDAVPAPHASRAAAEADFRHAFAHLQNVARMLLPARARDLFVKHPRLGDLTLPEWMGVHVRHAKHHARQIRRRLGA